LHSVVAKIPLPAQYFNYIDGKAVHGGLPTIAVDNPATGEVFAQAPSASSAQLDDAVTAARNALTGWTLIGEGARKKYMMKVAAELMKPEIFLLLGKVLCMEQGKPLASAVGEVLGAAKWIQATNTYSVPPPETVLEDKKMKVVQHMRPVGVVAAICPWNYPVLLAMWKIAPAMVCGCTMVLKPSPSTPLATTLLGKILADVLPRGVVNTLAGGNELGQWMTTHAGFDKISFTGSVPTGKAIQKSAAGTLKRLTLELGGNDAAIVMPGTDVDAIAPQLFEGAFGNSGQVCAAIKRLYVHDDDHDALVAAMKKEAAKTNTGNGMSARTTHGPLANAMQLSIVEKLVDDAKKRGATIETGGHRVGPAAGYAYAPTLITNVDDSFNIVSQEQFGPALPILKYSDVNDAVNRANDCSVGLGGSVWGNDADAAAVVAAVLQSGTAWVNSHKVMHPAAPFGGFKQSGIGRENGQSGLLAFLEAQTFNVAKNAKWTAKL